MAIRPRWRFELADGQTNCDFPSDQNAIPMEKSVTIRALKDFREKENPWKHRSYEERLIAMAVICGTTQKDGQAELGFPRFYRAFRRGEG